MYGDVRRSLLVYGLVVREGDLRRMCTRGLGLRDESDLLVMFRL